MLFGKVVGYETVFFREEGTSSLKVCWGHFSSNFLIEQNKQLEMFNRLKLETKV